ncbi:MAG: ATP-dependent DNA helicase RecG [Thermobacillus sp. ZCTH02-B1]|uniref:ATP-dependent DNA helicase RecG n=1 Tax=Thermobacillus sp. ZCTH02-B1 TaxID=1858795 RepID=UPI000B56B3E3|nr:ATP-dependent DNA helicase RecG [Thermobacillus sp. ZCTH02-B1]OUM96423.1 MAG: ATP-dependent DNA helicase RecG [Thermobacillus sp. ZCTH02-B1]
MTLRLEEIPVRHIKGVSARREEELHAFGIRTVAELLEHFPFRYEDYRVRDPEEVGDGEKATIRGRIAAPPVVQRYGGKTRMTCRVAAGRMLVTAVWFNRHFLKDQLTPGRDITLTGKWDRRRRQITVAESEFPDRGAVKTGTLQPVYSVGGGITQNWMRKTIAQALLQFGHLVPEVLPPGLIERRGLMPRREAMMRIHAPGSEEEGAAARRRMAYEELFLFQLKLQAFRAHTRRKRDGIAHRVDSESIRAFAAGLPFELTEGQKKAVNEILRDMRQPYCMNRLLQGDVGSGKTVVAAIALYAAVKSGHQGALMAPTEILAEQHLRTLEKLLGPHGIQVALLTGSLTERQRRDVLAGLQMGVIDVVVGTHALIQDDVQFRSLSLVVTDEQHRFGVEQRSILRRKGIRPDVLTMTATPIPRTLAITAFGDMDVSTLRERPKGRVPVKTYWVRPGMMERVLGFIRREVAAGRQAYVICPLIEESDKLDVENVIDLHRRMVEAFPDFKVGLLHGRLSAAEKDAVMRAFSSGETQVLVATTVVEVGVDVPNASLMVVMDADRFGLSQLHQLRGRVGRGTHASYCVLIADPKSEAGLERMRIMTETDDGFEVSRRDLELRGPGDFFGTKQSGLPDFKVADLTTDFALLEMARDDAADLVSREAFWRDPACARLRELLTRDPVFQGEQLD